MQDKTVLSHVKRLSAVNGRKDIMPLSWVTYPGTHCPLFGAALTVRQLKNAVMLVIGTEECTYYTKSLSLVYGEFGGLDGRCLSFVMDKHDVTFGCKEKLERAAQELVEEYAPEAVFLVTTCVPEMTGEDIDSAAESLWKAHGIPFLPVHTDHFRCDGHLSGIQNVWAACAALMEPSAPVNGVNLLGKKAGRSELARLLEAAGVAVHRTLPSDCSLEEIKSAPAARLNIVCSKQGLLLAKEMQRCFGTPWVSFYDRCRPAEIEEGYGMLFELLGKPVPAEVAEKAQRLREKLALAEGNLRGGTFILGNSSVEPFVLASFFAELGMELLLIQAKEFEASDAAHKEIILGQGMDPYVSQSANLAAMAGIYGLLKPCLYLGPAERDILLQHRIVGIGLPKAGQMLGFELAEHMLDCFTAGMERRRQIKENEI